jgi:hypothetical protein
LKKVKKDPGHTTGPNKKLFFAHLNDQSMVKSYKASHKYLATVRAPKETQISNLIEAGVNAPLRKHLRPSRRPNYRPGNTAPGISRDKKYRQKNGSKLTSAVAVKPRSRQGKRRKKNWGFSLGRRSSVGVKGLASAKVRTQRVGKRNIVTPYERVGS